VDTEVGCDCSDGAGGTEIERNDRGRKRKGKEREEKERKGKEGAVKGKERIGKGKREGRGREG
jgi:hypothetical protein